MAMPLKGVYLKISTAPTKNNPVAIILQENFLEYFFIQFQSFVRRLSYLHPIIFFNLVGVAERDVILLFLPEVTESTVIDSFINIG